MNRVMDSTDSIIGDPHAEVRKLQDLVKKLEQQNEILRSKQKKPQPPVVVVVDSLQNGDVDSNRNDNRTATVVGNSRKQLHSLVGRSLDDVEVIDIDSEFPNDDEDSWLYSSPRAPTPVQRKVSPYRWIREEFDHPKPHVESVRKSLVFKLEEVARMSRMPSSHSMVDAYNSRGCNSPAAVRVKSSLLVNCSQERQPLVLSSLGSRVDTNTFTRPRKNRERLKVVGIYKADHNISDDPDGQRIPDVSDIQNRAKQQEESLRQSFSPISSPRKGLRSRQVAPPPPPPPNPAPGGTSDTELSGSPVGSNRSSPGRFDEGISNRRHSNSIPSTGSDISSPPDSPYSSQYLNTNYGAQENRKSVGILNVSKLCNSPPAMHSSDSSLDTGSDEMPYMAPESKRRSRLPGRPISPSISHLKQPSMVRKGSSPQRSSLPQPSRRSVPKPASGGKRSIPTPKKTGIVCKPLERNIQLDDSWKEGCF